MGISVLISADGLNFVISVDPGARHKTRCAGIESGGKELENGYFNACIHTQFEVKTQNLVTILLILFISLLTENSHKIKNAVPTLNQT